MQKDLGEYRKTYQKSALMEDAVPEDPFALFQKWFDEVEASEGVEEPNAMTVSTVGLDGYPKNRVVLLKELAKNGFVFYTNYESEKGKAIAEYPQLCLSFFWPNLERQVIIKGRAERVSTEESDAYFRSRPKGSQMGALVSDQSRVIPSREPLEDQLADLREKYREREVERPGHWGGYLVKPVSIEFWQGRPNRLHDRIRYTRQNASDSQDASDRQETSGWKMERLAP